MLWYTHKSVGWKLKLAEKLIDKIFTASKESFRFPSEKVEITGHGIDLEKFKTTEIKKGDSKFKIISVGRIAPVKNYEILIKVTEILKTRVSIFRLKLPERRFWKLIKFILKNLKIWSKKKLDGIIEFVGPIPNKDIAEFYQSGDLFVNLSDTGSLDKAVLEAMACGLKILTSNEAFKSVLKEENITDKNLENIANKIIYLAKKKKIIHWWNLWPKIII